MTTRPAEPRRTRHPSADFDADGKYIGDPGRRPRVRQRELSRLPGHGETVGPGAGPRDHALRGTDSPANGRTLADNAREAMLSSSPLPKRGDDLATYDVDDRRSGGDGSEQCVGPALVGHDAVVGRLN
jgi:hypothetical protein